MRKRFKIPLIFILSVLILFITAIVLLYKSHILENWVNRYLADKVAERYNLDITIEEIEGSFVNGFVLSDVYVQYFGDKDTVMVAELPWLKIDYHVSDFWNRKWIIDSVRFHNPIINLIKNASGKWLLPIPAYPRESKDVAPTWEIGSLNLDSAVLKVGLPQKTIELYDVNMQASIKSEGGTHTIDLARLSFDSDDRRLRVRRVDGQATIFEDNIVFRNINLVTDSSKLAFSLMYENKEQQWVEAIIDSAHIHLADAVSFVGSTLSGDIDFNGLLFHKYGKSGGDLTVSGIFEGRSFDSLFTKFRYDGGIIFFDTLYGRAFQGCSVEGFGDIDLGSDPPGYRASVKVDSFDLNRLIFNSFTSNLTGQVELSGRGFRSDDMIIDLDLNLSESFFDIYHFHRADGQMTISTDGLYFFPGFQFYYYLNRFLFGGSVAYDGNLELDGHADLVDLTSFVHQTFIDLPAGRADVDFRVSGPTVDPDLSGLLESDSVWFYQYWADDFKAEFDIHSFTKSMRGPVKVLSIGGEAWGFPYDSMRADLNLDSTILFIDSLYTINEFSTIRATGELDFMAYPQSLTLNDILINLSDRRFRSNGNQQILVDSSGFIFDRLKLDDANGKISIAGRTNYDETLDISWDLDRISIAPWAMMINDSLFIDGLLSSKGNIKGSFDSPQFNLRVDIDSMSYRSLLLGDLRGFLTYRDSTLFIDSSFLSSPDGIYEAYGMLPINLALNSEHDIFDDRNQDIFIKASDKRLDLAAFILNSVDYVTGDFAAEIELTGQPLQPHLNGVCSLHRGNIKLSDLRDRLENVEVELAMADQLITLIRAEADAPHKGKDQGKITAGGTIIVNDINSMTYDLDVSCNDLPIDYELGDFSGRADAEVYINGETPPIVTGTILMHSGYYRENFSEGESGFNLLTALESDKTWDLDLMVECPSNVWVKNEDIDAEFSGSINILRQAGVYNYLGTLEVIRGKYFFYTNTFRFTPGGQIIYNNIEKPDPELNLEMSTRIRSHNQFSDYGDEGNYSYELGLRITGTLNNPDISGTGDTPISKEEILPTLLTGSQASGDGSQDRETVGTSRITSGLGGLLAGQFTRLGTRTLGVETFEIAPNWENKFDPSGTRLTIGAYTLPNLYVFGSSYFDVERGQEVGVEYRLGRHYLFEGRRDESNLYHLDLKLYWEY